MENMAEITPSHSLKDFAMYYKCGILGDPTMTIDNPAINISTHYVEKGIPVHARPAWYQQIMGKVIYQGTHIFACTTDMTMFIQGEMTWWVRYIKHTITRG